MISPRALFRKNEADARSLAIAINEQWFQRAVSASLADLAISELSSDRLSGANDFIARLESLAVDDKPTDVMPDKSNLPSYNN